jgi:hypothetical protein
MDAQTKVAKYLTMSNVAMTIVALAAFAGLILASVAFTNKNGGDRIFTNVTVSQINAKAMANAGTPIIFGDAIQSDGTESAPNIFGATNFNGTVTMAAPQPSASPINLNVNGGTINTSNLLLNTFPIGQVIANSNTLVKSSATQNVEVFSNVGVTATLPTTFSNTGFVVPSNFETAGTIVISMTGRNGAITLATVPRLYIQIGTGGTALLFTPSATQTGTAQTAGTAFTATLTLSSISSTASYCSANSSYCTGPVDSITMGPLVAGTPVNIIVGNTTAAADINVYHFYVRYYPNN